MTDEQPVIEVTDAPIDTSTEESRYLGQVNLPIGIAREIEAERVARETTRKSLVTELVREAIMRRKENGNWLTAS